MTDIQRMFAVTFNRPVAIDTRRDYVARRPPGVSYLMTDYHVQESPPAIFRRREPYQYGRRFEGQSLQGGSLAMVWLAGLGDTISLAPGLMALQRANPQARIDVITVPVLFEVLTAAGFEGRCLDYPPTREEIEAYDWFLPVEGVNTLRTNAEQDSIAVYAQLLGQPADVPLVEFYAEPRWGEDQVDCLPAAVGPRIGVQARALSPIRTYPPELLAELLKMLLKKGFEVHILGQAGNCNIASTPPRLYNACGRTASFAQTLAYVRQMDGLICPDSYLMHLGGALGIPTVALFSTVAARLRSSRYPTVTAMEPDFPCAPCLTVTEERCPLGYADCHALRSPSMRPGQIVRCLEQALERSTANII